MGPVLAGAKRRFQTANALRDHDVFFHVQAHLGACLSCPWFATITAPMLTLSEVSKAYGGRTLFANVSLQVNREDRLGLVGPNGAGKSTLFALILGAASADAGSIGLQNGMKLGHLPQENAPVGEETVLELATAVTPEMADLQTRLRAPTPGTAPDALAPAHAPVACPIR